jgi:hypothetical protein
VLRENDIYNLIIALLSMGVTMLWGKEQKDHPNSEDSASEGDAQYRWNDREWRVPSYKHWEAGNSDYQADERRYWRHQVRALWAGVGIGIATLLAACSAAAIAWWAYGAASDTVIEAKKQTAEAARQAKAAEDQLELAKKSFVVDHRPYVFAQIMGNEAARRWEMGGIPNQIDPLGTDATIVIVNYGRGPAIIEHAQCQVVLYEYEIMAPSSPFAFPVTLINEGIVLAEGDHPINAGCTIRPVGVNRIPKGDSFNAVTEHDHRFLWTLRGLWILVDIQYTDTFKNPFSTTVCVRYDGFVFRPRGGPACNKRD